MSYLSGIARLPASRKIIIGVVTAAATAGNEWMRQRAGFALPVEVVGMLIVVAVANILSIAIEDSAKAIAEARKADPTTPPVVFTRSESGRANTSGLVAFLGGCLLAVAAILASGCGSGPAARHAADEARRAAQYVAWMESGSVPVRAGVLEPASLTHALPMLRSQARAWEAQAYYLGSGPRPAWVREEE